MALDHLSLRSRFHIDPSGRVQLERFGTYCSGLTSEEIKDYLRVRTGKLRIEQVYKQFCKIAGVNTMSSATCPYCQRLIGLMYRHDVERFADALLGKIPTYFD